MKDLYVSKCHLLTHTAGSELPAPGRRDVSSEWSAGRQAVTSVLQQLSCAVASLRPVWEVRGEVGFV